RGADEPDGDLPDRRPRRREHLAAEIDQRAELAAREELRDDDVAAAAAQHELRMVRIEASRHGAELHAGSAEHEGLAAADEYARRDVRLRDLIDVDKLGEPLEQLVALVEQIARRAARAR